LWTNSAATPGALSRQTSSAQPGLVTIQLNPIVSDETTIIRQTVTRRLKLAGRVQTATGEPLPGGLRVSVRTGTENSYAEPDAAGKFRFHGLPYGQVTIVLEPGMQLSHEDFRKPYRNGWRLAARNRNRRLLGQDAQLVGQLDHDKDDLLLVVEHVN